MPNPNIEELAALIAIAPTKGTIQEVATFLAARGVLVISDAVLTDEALGVVWDEGVADSYTRDSDGGEYASGYDFVYPERMRSALSRLAKGDGT